jgi:hypothetical protein
MDQGRRTGAEDLGARENKDNRDRPQAQAHLTGDAAKSSYAGRKAGRLSAKQKGPRQAEQLAMPRSAEQQAAAAAEPRSRLGGQGVRG